MPEGTSEVQGRTLGGMLRDVADRRPDAPFLLSGDRVLTYGTVAERARSLAAALHSLGVEPGDRVAVDLPNWPEFAVAVFAAAELGAVIVPLDPGYAPRELQFMLRNSEAVAAVTAERYRGTDFLELFESLLVELPDLQYLVTVGEEELWYDDRIFQFEDLVSSGTGRPLRVPDPDPADVFAILYTAGTTGKPKGVMLTQDNLARTARGTARALGLRSEDVTLCVVPLFHIFGLGAALLTAAASGSAVALQERFDPAEALRLVERHGATVLHGVPTMFLMMERALAPDEAGDRPDLSTLRAGIAAGAPVSESLATRMRERLVPGLEIAYGMTETSPTVTLTRPEDPEVKRKQTVGRPLEGVRVRILDDAGDELPPESVGEVAVQGFNVMSGYFRQPSETETAFTADGFLRTGDLGMVDEDGYLHIVGRVSDVIIRGGYNVHPREVEDHLRSHPAVLDVAVIGVPNEMLGELVCACVRPVEGAIITEEELRDYCRTALADYKVPDEIRFMEEFPMTPSGKARRMELTRLVRAD